MTIPVHPDTPASGSAIDEAMQGLASARRAWRDRHPVAISRFPDRGAIERALELLSAALYPQRIGGYRGRPEDEDRFVAAKLMAALVELEREVGHELAYWQDESQARFDPDQASLIVRLFAATLGEVRRLTDSDVEAAFLGDPAARSVHEILICYPGAIASLHHRIAHPLYELGAPIVARIVSELANGRTGIDIHPGATIGGHFFIDHGTGVVIGETAIIGERVRLYQHVTLGARTPAGTTDLAPRDRYARHPIVEDDVVIYAGATILGRVSIGRGTTIGGNVWLLSDVPPDSIVTQPEAIRLSRAEGERLREALT